MGTLENRFHEEMKNIYFTAKKELKYNALKFFQLVSREGGVKAEERETCRNRLREFGYEM